MGVRLGLYRQHGKPVASGFADNEIIPADLAIGRIGNLQKQAVMKDRVPPVVGFARKVELGGQDPPAGRLDLDMKMARAARIKPRNDGIDDIAALIVAELVAAKPIAAVVVITRGVRMPQFDQRIGDRITSTVEHETQECDRLTRPSSGSEIVFQRRVWREEWALGLRPR